MSIQIYGASDDLIEIEGDINEEFSWGDDEALLAFSDGTILRIKYATSGIWRITPIVTGSAAFQIKQAPEHDDNGYTDVATLDGDVRWVVCGVAWAKARPTTKVDDSE